MSSELIRSPSMSKMQARTAGKLMVFVSFGFYLYSPIDNSIMPALNVKRRYLCWRSLTLS